MEEKFDISLSFMDVLTCALGGIILLFVIFTTMTHQGIARPLVNEDKNLQAIVDSKNEVESGKISPEEIPHLAVLTIQGKAKVLIEENKNISITHTSKNDKSIYHLFLKNPKNADQLTVKLNKDKVKSFVTLTVVQPLPPGKSSSIPTIYKEKFKKDQNLKFSLAQGWEIN